MENIVVVLVLTDHRFVLRAVNFLTCFLKFPDFSLFFLLTVSYLFHFCTYFCVYIQMHIQIVAGITYKNVFVFQFFLDILKIFSTTIHIFLPGS